MQCTCTSVLLLIATYLHTLLVATAAYLSTVLDTIHAHGALHTTYIRVPYNRKLCQEKRLTNLTNQLNSSTINSSNIYKCL